MSYTPQGHTQKEKDSQGERTYIYNAAERMVEVRHDGQQTITYRYDPMGRRISKTMGLLSSTNYYFYSDSALMAEANSQEEIIRAYGWNSEANWKGLWSTDPVWQAQIDSGSLTTASTEYHYLHTDHLYTPKLATSEQGNTSWRGISEAFGATETIANVIEVDLRFPGQYWDKEAGTHYNFYRDYLPGSGRYLQSDPIGMYGGDNFYVYIESGVINKFDSFGLKSDKDPTPGIIDWAKDHACRKGCDWVYKKCRETWMRYCVAFGRSTACAELCEFQVPETCQREKDKRCPDPVSCVDQTGGSFG